MKTIGLVQAHHRDWNGAIDLSLAKVNGKPAVAEVIGRLKAMPQIAQVVVAVPDDPGNEIFREIAAEHGALCHFGARENVLARCAAAMDSVGAQTAIHVLGHHCFIDVALLGEMLAFLQDTGAGFVSLPDAFTPYLAGKVYRRAVLDQVADAIAARNDDRELHSHRFVSLIESDCPRFGALTYENLPHYDGDFLLKVHEAAREIFADDRVLVDSAATGPDPLFEFDRGRFMAWDMANFSVAELRAILEQHFPVTPIPSSEAGARRSEDRGGSQKMVAHVAR